MHSRWQDRLRHEVSVLVDGDGVSRQPHCVVRWYSAALNSHAPDTPELDILNQELALTVSGQKLVPLWINILHRREIRVDQPERLRRGLVTSAVFIVDAQHELQRAHWPRESSNLGAPAREAVPPELDHRQRIRLERLRPLEHPHFSSLDEVCVVGVHLEANARGVRAAFRRLEQRNGPGI